MGRMSHSQHRSVSGKVNVIYIVQKRIVMLCCIGLAEVILQSAADPSEDRLSNVFLM